MQSIFARYRSIVVLLAILLLQVMGLAVQVAARPTDKEQSTPKIPGLSALSACGPDR